MPNPSLAQLNRAIQIQEQIDKLEVELRALLAGEESAATEKSEGSKPAAKADKRKGKRTPEQRATMAAAQKARWANATTETRA